MRNKGDQNRPGVGGAMPPMAFQGLGLPMDAVLFKAARVRVRLARTRCGAPVPRSPEPPAPRGPRLLAALCRYTRAG